MRLIELIRMFEDSVSTNTNTTPRTQTAHHSSIPSTDIRSSMHGWNWYDVSANPNITLSDILSNPNLNWSKYGFMSNPTLTLNDLDYLYSRLWNDTLMNVLNRHNTRTHYMTNIRPEIYLASNHAIPIEWFFQTKDQYNWSWYELTQHREMTLDHLTNHYDVFRPVSMRVMQNPSIPLDDILGYIGENPSENTMLISTHPEITIDHITQHPHIRWHFPTLSYHPNMTPEIIRQSRDTIQWYPYHYFKNPNFSIDELKNTVEPHVFSHYGMMYSKNPRVTMSMIQEHPEIRWSDKLLSANPSIRVRDIAHHPQRNWDYAEVMRNRFGWSPIEYNQRTNSKRLEQTYQQTQVYRDELLGRAWSPERMRDWCMDIEEQDGLAERWCD